MAAITKTFRLNPKLPGVFKYGGNIASAYVLRRALMLEEEMDMLLDETWLKNGLFRLSTVEAIEETLNVNSATKTSMHAQIATLESAWYMRNQLLRDSDWASMALGVELRMPYFDVSLLTSVGPPL